ncbi:MAG TPA: hypothetical protein VFZ31_09405 [Vicinamibacterales bacterium]
MASAMANARSGHYLNTPAGKLSHQLAYFSIALGALELFAAPRLTRMLGMRGKEDLIRAYGVREIVKGVGILSSPNPTPWLWGRVAGDALDLATLASAYPNNPKSTNVAIAIANVAAVSMLDLMCAQQLGAIQVRQRMPMRDYSDRSGLPRGVEASRGAAADAPIPADMRTPAALRPLA